MYWNVGQLIHSRVKLTFLTMLLLYQVITIQVSCGSCHTASLTRAGTMFTWGDNRCDVVMLSRKPSTNNGVIQPIILVFFYYRVVRTRTWYNKLWTTNQPHGDKIQFGTKT